MRQSDEFPVELVGYSTMGITSLYKEKDYPNIEFSDRFTFVHQVLISRKFSEKISLELVPSYVHKNLIDPTLENDNQFA